MEPLNNANIVGSYDYPSKCNEEPLRIPINREQKIEIVCRVQNHLKAILSDQSILEFVLKLQKLFFPIDLIKSSY